LIAASKTTFSHYNLKILRPRVTKNLTNFCKKFCEFPPRLVNEGDRSREEFWNRFNFWNPVLNSCWNKHNIWKKTRIVYTFKSIFLTHYWLEQCFSTGVPLVCRELLPSSKIQKSENINHEFFYPFNFFHNFFLSLTLFLLLFQGFFCIYWQNGISNFIFRFSSLQVMKYTNELFYEVCQFDRKLSVCS